MDVHRVTLWTLTTHDRTGLLKNRKRTTRTHRRQYVPLSWVEAWHVPDSLSVAHTYTCIVYHAISEHTTIQPIMSPACALMVRLYNTCTPPAVLGRRVCPEEHLPRCSEQRYGATTPHPCMLSVYTPSEYHSMHVTPVRVHTPTTIHASSISI